MEPAEQPDPYRQYLPLEYKATHRPSRGHTVLRVLAYCDRLCLAAH